jgi:hypothetical protein
MKINIKKHTKKYISRSISKKGTLSLLDCQNSAKIRSGFCLSKKYVNAATSMIWKCSKGHVWNTNYAAIRRGTWCRICAMPLSAEKRRTSIEFFKEYAISRKGLCLSDTYINQKSILKFKCANNHIWEVRGASLKGGKTWCRFCSGHYAANTPELQQQRLNELIEIAASKGGECLSETYVNNNTKVKFKCAKGHVWETGPGQIRAGRWCKRCASVKANEWKKDKLETFVKIIEAKGGKCLTTEYINSQVTRLVIECGKGHQWATWPGHVKKGLWCRKCNGSAKHSLSDVIRLAESRGGKCLSENYKNDMSNITWQCNEGHIWDATPNNIKHGRWCPTCAPGFGERVCRLFFEKIFEKPFIKTRPNWLMSKRGFPLELDGFCEELNLAFEHQGEQHYKKVHFFRDSPNSDQLKRNVCKRKGIALIEIPEVPAITKIKDLKDVIVKECLKKDVNLPQRIAEIEITDYEIFTCTESKKRKELIEVAKKIITEKEGETIHFFLISDSTPKLKIKCKNDHTWSCSVSNIIKGKWCTYCHRESIQKLKASSLKGKKPRLWGPGNRVHTIEEMQQIAQSKGGLCLSSDYNGGKLLLWQCEKAHQWEAPATSILKGRWCSFCAGYKIHIEWILQRAKEKEGVCLSTEYINNTTLLRFKCKFGHTFNTSAHSLRAGSWCHTCAINFRADKKRTPISSIQELAEKRGGKLISENYQHMFQRVLWECANGHQWYATSQNIKWGKWCRICSRESSKLKNLERISENIKKLVEDKKGYLIKSEAIITRNSMATWKCDKGHVWNTRVVNILIGHWCARCANSKNWNGKRTTISDVQAVARSRDGKCLSSKYSYNSKLEFKCKDGHVWSALWSNIKLKNSWCPVCARKNRKSNITRSAS